MIKIKLLNLLNQRGRNLHWLATNANISYSSLYNFAHQKTSSVSYDMLEKICKTLRCDIEDIIVYIPTGIDMLPQSNLDMLENAIDTLVYKKTNNETISKDEESFLYQLFIRIIKEYKKIQATDTMEKFNSAYKKCIEHNLLPNKLIFKINVALWQNIQE